VEKRAVLAFVLMFLVIVVYMFVVRPQGQAPPPAEVAPPDTTQQAPVSKEVINEADTLAAESPREIGLPVENAPGKTVVVRTPLYTARLSTVGGVMESLTLHDYLYDGDRPVELIPQAARMPLALTLRTTDGGSLDLSTSTWTVSRDSLEVGKEDEARLRFTLVTAGGLTVTKTCVFRGDTYLFGVDVGVSGPDRHMISAYEIGWASGLRVTEIHREKDDLSNFASLTLSDEGLRKSTRRNLANGEEVVVKDHIQWAGVKTKYFLAAIIPEEAKSTESRAFQAGEQAIGVTLEAVPSQAGAQDFLVYVGPLDFQRLGRLGHGLDKAVDFGWSWIRPLSKLVFRFLLLVHHGIPNYGIVIILLSALTKLLFWPLTQKSFKSMRDMQKLQPKLAELREKYKNDSQKLNKAMMELYREHNVNPLGGCLPMLLQMPVFIALFNVLRTTIELRRAPFFLWIKDLSSPDVLAHLPFALPFIGQDLSLLPILMGVAMFVQQKMQSTDPKQAALTYMMPVLFTVLFFKFPSGLVLYWLVNNVLTIGHQHLMNRAEEAQQV
jgi:YidC/Oxa1 family membrane protein insertase